MSIDAVTTKLYSGTLADHLGEFFAGFYFAGVGPSHIMDSHVKVAIRIRPVLQTEIGSEEILEYS